jgi:dihydrodiol dehydrogenase / D-xylose 1-dehydrogenase (NADP)
MNWGIIGYGEIAPSFIEGLRAASDSNLVGIASISSYDYLKKMRLYNDAAIYGSYDELLRVEYIDIVYICTTNQLHFKNVKDALNAGKHVLCEKPMTPTLKDTIELCKLAKEKKLFLMEGMWTRYIPAYREAMRMISDGIIGKPKLLKVDFGFLNNWSKHRRLLNPELFGGTLLDNADYNIFLSQDVFKEFPNQINAQATYADTGVEDACSIILKYSSGGMAQLYSSFRCHTKQEAIIYGEKGYIKLNEYWQGTEIELNLGKRTESKEYPFKANGFEYEIEAVEQAISEGKTESDIIPHLVSKEIATIMDEVKKIVKN